MTFRKILLFGIILATFVNLLTNSILNYLPDSKVYAGTYTVATITIIIVCVLILIFGSESSTKGFLARVWKPDFLTRLQPNITPRKKITFISYTEGRPHRYWDYIESDGEPAMSIKIAWNVTNLTNKDIWILRAYLEKPRTDGAIWSRAGYRSGSISISPEYPITVFVTFCIQPPTCQEDETFKGKVVFVDHTDKQHKVKVALKPPIQVGETETEDTEVGETEDTEDDDIPF